MTVWLAFPKLCYFLNRRSVPVFFNPAVCPASIHHEMQEQIEPSLNCMAAAFFISGLRGAALCFA